jgi:ABC-type nitrate/sulfonate/bicarbonate transport system permease component
VSARRLLAPTVFIAAIAVWEGWARAEASFLVPPPSAVAERAWDVWPTREFLGNVQASLTRLAAGLGVGACAGVAVGLLVGGSVRVRRVVEPLFELLRAVPPIAVVPVAIVVFGLGDAMLVSVIAFGVFFPVFVHTAEGVRGVSPEARDTAAMLHVGPVERLYRVYLPAALPSIATGFRVAISIGLVLVVISELTGASDGLGYFVLQQQRDFDVPGMYAGIVFLGLLGYILNRLFLLVERHLLAWHHGAVGAVER